jgi:hypothetical protein
LCIGDGPVVVFAYSKRLDLGEFKNFSGLNQFILTSSRMLARVFAYLRFAPHVAVRHARLATTWYTHSFVGGTYTPWCSRPYQGALKVFFLVFLYFLS